MVFCLDMRFNVNNSIQVQAHQRVTTDCADLRAGRRGTSGNVWARAIIKPRLMAKQERPQSRLGLRVPTRKTVIQTFHLITTTVRGEGGRGEGGGLCSQEHHVLMAGWKRISLARHRQRGPYKSASALKMTATPLASAFARRLPPQERDVSSLKPGIHHL